MVLVSTYVFMITLAHVGNHTLPGQTIGHLGTPVKVGCCHLCQATSNARLDVVRLELVAFSAATFHLLLSLSTYLVSRTRSLWNAAFINQWRSAMCLSHMHCGKLTVITINLLLQQNGIIIS